METDKQFYEVTRLCNEYCCGSILIGIYDSKVAADNAREQYLTFVGENPEYYLKNAIIKDIAIDTRVIKIACKNHDIVVNPDGTTKIYVLTNIMNTMGVTAYNRMYFSTDLNMIAEKMRTSPKSRFRGYGYETVTMNTFNYKRSKFDFISIDEQPKNNQDNIQQVVSESINQQVIN